VILLFVFAIFFALVMFLALLANITQIPWDLTTGMMFTVFVLGCLTVRRRPRNRRLALLAIASTTALILLLFCLGLRWVGVSGTLTDSEPPGLYREIGGAPIRGGMIELRRLTKYIAAVPGDTVRVTPEGSYINGKLWPYSAPITGSYEHYPFGTYKLQPGQYWVLGQNPRSWDSRYLGRIPADMLNCRVEPLLTVSNGYARGTLPW
jgi:Signal peptidase, peptidase S26